MTFGEESSTLSVVAPGAAASTPRRREHAFPMLYRMIRGGCIPVLRSQFDYRVTGLERLPASGPFILAANHHNYLDGVLLGTAVPRPISFLVMPRVYRASPLHPLLSPAHRIDPRQPRAPRPRRHQARAASARRRPHRRHLPGGSVQPGGRLVGGHPGVALIALRSGVPVVPAAIHGTYEALRGRRFYVPRAHPLSVRFGTPMHFGWPRHRRVTRAERDEVTRRIMGEIAALLAAEREPVTAVAPGRAGAS